MMPVDFNALAQQCAPDVHPVTLQAIVHTESGFNPFAIGVVGGRLQRQPRDLGEAVATARALEAAGWNYSMGLAQVNRANLVRYGLDATSVFDPCANLRAGAAILSDCYARASVRNGAGAGQTALQQAVSCYYSGNFARGFQREGGSSGSSYVERVIANAPVTAAPAAIPPAASMPTAAGKPQPIPVVPALAPGVKTARPSPAGDAVSVEQGSALSGASRSRSTWDAFGDF